MKTAVFEENLIRALEVRSQDSLCIFGDYVAVNNNPHTRVLKLQMGKNPLMPLIYVDEYEERYENGEPLEEIADGILESLRKNQRTAGISMEFFMDFGNVRNSVFCKAVNAEKNRELLKQAPHEIHEDLAVMYYCELEKTGMKDATVLIRNDHLDLWNCREEELRSTAWKNTREKKKIRFQKLTQVLAELGFEEMQEAENNPLYLLTNEDGAFGAAAAFYPHVLADCALQLNSNLILLPCSIHEWLLIPSDLPSARENKEELRSMVRDINRTQVADRDVLSDEIYFYDLETDRIYRM